MTKVKNWKEAQEQALVLNTCFEIGASVSPNFFYSKFKNEINFLSELGISQIDYKKLSEKINEVISSKHYNDKLFLEGELLFDIFEEIGSSVEKTKFLDMFEQETNSLSSLGISDAKYEEIAYGVKSIREIINIEFEILEQSKQNSGKHPLILKP